MVVRARRILVDRRGGSGPGLAAAAAVGAGGGAGGSGCGGGAGAVVGVRGCCRTGPPVASKGVGVRVITALAGHKNIGTTQRYIEQ